MTLHTASDEKGLESHHLQVFPRHILLT